MDSFDPQIPIERATTPPSSWYTDPAVLTRERSTAFRRSWQAVGRAESLAMPGDFLSGDLAGEPYVVVRDRTGDLRAFYNVCRHHATCVAQGSGNTEQLVCPYHGWTYGLDGRLLKAPRMAGVEAFDRDDNGLVPMQVATWGPWVFLRQEAGGPGIDQVLQPLHGRLDADTVFDYFFDRDVEPDFIEASLAASHQVQLEDIAICESVQRGLGSAAYDVGRYAPRVEGAEHHFHSLLAGELQGAGT